MRLGSGGALLPLHTSNWCDANFKWRVLEVAHDFLLEFKSLSVGDAPGLGRERCSRHSRLGSRSPPRRLQSEASQGRSVRTRAITRCFSVSAAATSHGLEPAPDTTENYSCKLAALSLADSSLALFGSHSSLHPLVRYTTNFPEYTYNRGAKLT